MSQMADRTALVDRAMKEAANNGMSLSARQANALAAQVERLGRSMGAMGSRADQMRAKLASMGAVGTFGTMIDDFEQVQKAAQGAHGGMAGISRELMVMSHEALTGNFKRLGGSAMVLGERLNILHYVLSPMGAAFAAGAAGVAAFLYQLYQGVEETEAFNAALTTTSNALGMTAGDMRALADGVGVARVSFVTVREGMAQVGATGAFTANQLQLATAAAVSMAADTGTSTEKAAAALAKVQDGVMKWVTEYQQAHHAFTAAQVEEIENFVKQGDTVNATKAIMSDLVGVHAQLAKDADANMGTVVRWWHAVEDAVSGVKRAIADMGTPDTLAKQIADQTEAVQKAQSRYQSFQYYDSHSGEAKQALQDLNDQQAALKKLLDLQGDLKKQSQDKRAGDAKVAVDNYVNSSQYATPDRRHSLDLQKEDEDFKKATANLDKNSADYQTALKRHYENVQQINAQYAKRSRTPETSQNLALTSLADRNKLIESELGRHIAVIEGQRKAGLLDAQRAADQEHALQLAALNQEIALAQQRESIAKTKRNPVAAQKASDDVSALTSKRDDLNDSYDNSFVDRMSKAAESIKKFQDAQDAAVSKQRQAFAVQNATQFMSPQQAQNYTKQVQLYETYQQQLEAINEKYNNTPQADQQVRDAALQSLQQHYQQQQQMLQQQMDYEQQLRSSYSGQMQLAMTQLSGNGQTAAQTTADAFTQAWQDSANALNSFLTTGKGSFDQFVAGALADMAKIALQFAEMQAMQGIMHLAGVTSPLTSAFSTGGPVGHFADGGSIAGPGTGTSDSIPAMLSNGEYVINAASTKKYRSVLDAINTGNLSHFAGGGAVGSVQSSASSGASSGSNPVSVTVHNNGSGGLTDNDAKELHSIVSAFVDRRITQRFRGQGGLAYQMRHGQV